MKYNNLFLKKNEQRCPFITFFNSNTKIYSRTHTQDIFKTSDSEIHKRL